MISRRLAVGLTASALGACLLGPSCAPRGQEMVRSAAVAEGTVPEELVIRVTGREYKWHLLYPGADGELGTADDFEAERHIHVPAETHVRLELESEDYMYQLGVPDFGVREIAVPDLDFSMEFGSGAPGKHRLEGDQFCGFSHPDLRADLVVMTDEDYLAWVAAHR